MLARFSRRGETFVYVDVEPTQASRSRPGHHTVRRERLSASTRGRASFPDADARLELYTGQVLDALRAISARLDVLETAVRGGTAVLQKDVREVREGVAALEAKAADAAAAAAAPASSAKASERSEPGGIPPDERRAEREDLGRSSEAVSYTHLTLPTLLLV